MRSSRCPATSSAVTVILFSVSVPVLSEQMTVTEPSVSTAGSFRISALRFSIFCAPSASAMVTTAGKPSGTAATAMLTAVRNISLNPSPRIIPSAKITTTITNAATARTRPRWSMRFWSGVGSDSTVWIIAAIAPSSVFIPVSATIPAPRPYVMIVPMKAMLRRSPIVTSFASRASVTFSTGSDSPVSAASCTRRFALSTRRRSAGTTLPASRRTTSPGTRSREEISRIWPSRRTRTTGVDIRFSAAIAFSARYSWLNPRIALSTTIVRIAIASFQSPRRADATAATMRMTTISAVICSQRIAHGLFWPRSTSSFGP